MCSYQRIVYLAHTLDVCQLVLPAFTHQVSFAEFVLYMGKVIYSGGSRHSHRGNYVKPL
jgi:hypothetical protein